MEYGNPLKARRPKLSDLAPTPDPALPPGMDESG
jgi:hypothetical protein